jgi:hypothetical protein
MSQKKFDLEEGQEVVRKTIVGGRPAARRKHKVKVPIGIEKVLVRAAADSEFRDRLFGERQATLDSLHDELSPTELKVLTTIPEGTLHGMIQSIDLQRHGKRRFMKGVVAATLIATAATGVLGCEVSESQPAGILAEDIIMDTVTETVIKPDVTINAGISPFNEVFVVEDNSAPQDASTDLEPEADVIEVPDMPSATGIMPDVEDPQ